MTDISIAKTRQDYNRIARHFSVTRNRLWPELNQFKNLVANRQNILDWGCGNGHLLEFFKGKDIKYFGVDISDSLINVAGELYRNDVKNGLAQFFNTWNEDKNFDDNFFDLVFMVASFHHLPDEKNRLEVLKKIYREMKIGGKLIITVWNLKSDWIQRKKEFEKVGENDYLLFWKNQNAEIITKLYYHHFEIEELRGLLESVGFIIEKIENSERNLVVLGKKRQ